MSQNTAYTQLLNGLRGRALRAEFEVDSTLGLQRESARAVLNISTHPCEFSCVGWGWSSAWTASDRAHTCRAGPSPSTRACAHLEPRPHSNNTRSHCWQHHVKQEHTKDSQRLVANYGTVSARARIVSIVSSLPPPVYLTSTKPSSRPDLFAKRLLALLAQLKNYSQVVC